MGDVTQILSNIESGDTGAAEQLLPLIYEELRRLAAAKMAGESPDQTLQATALVHEAYVRLVNVDQAQNWKSRGHFFVAAGEAMRRILVEAARRKLRHKHGGNMDRVQFDDAILLTTETPENIVAVHEALSHLETHHDQAAQLVKLRYFGGLTHQQSAEFLDISRREADRLWTVARAWLFSKLREF
jgi:RNA polymerase sigma factor (TIGR02999 family)